MGSWTTVVVARVVYGQPDYCIGSESSVWVAGLLYW